MTDRHFALRESFEPLPLPATTLGTSAWGHKGTRVWLVLPLTTASVMPERAQAASNKTAQPTARSWLHTGTTGAHLPGSNEPPLH